MSTQPESRTASPAQAPVAPASTETPPAEPQEATAPASFESGAAGPYGPPATGPYAPAPSWYPYLPERDVRMRRSGTDKMIAGVCGGIAEHTDIDPVYIRLAFLVSLFWGGIGFFAYLAAAVIMPKPLPQLP